MQIFREATIHDSQAILKLRNQEHVRANSFSDAEIPVSMHQPWFKQSLADPKRKIFVVEYQGYASEEIIGVIRADYKYSGLKLGWVVELSYFVDEDHCRQGIASGMMSMMEIKAKEIFPKIRAYEANTLYHNSASNSLLKKFDYKIHGIYNEKMSWCKIIKKGNLWILINAGRKEKDLSLNQR